MDITKTYLPLFVYKYLLITDLQQYLLHHALMNCLSKRSTLGHEFACEAAILCLEAIEKRSDVHIFTKLSPVMQLDNCSLKLIHRLY